MLGSTIPAARKRAALREMLSPGAARQFPGAFTPLSVRLIEEGGFDGVYISGAVLANELGLPDIGLTSLAEVAQRAGQIARATDLPAIVDADTGFGEPMNAARTVRELEAAGLAGCHLEDQVNPKRCGHLDGKQLVSVDAFQRRIAAAAAARADPAFLIMARTDARAVEGVAAAIDRAKAAVDAGADAIFPEAMRSVAEFEAVCRSVDVPVLANMTEFGQSELFSRRDLASAGVAMIIYPVTLLRAAMGAIERTLRTIRMDGEQSRAVPDMLTRARLYELVDYADFGAFDARVLDFQVPGPAGASPDERQTPHG